MSSRGEGRRETILTPGVLLGCNRLTLLRLFKYRKDSKA